MGHQEIMRRDIAMNVVIASSLLQKSSASSRAVGSSSNSHPAALQRHFSAFANRPLPPHFEHFAG
jgi:hypothetical protein